MKKLALIGIAVVIVVVILVIVYQPMQLSSSRSYKILKSSRNAVENFESLKADAFFFQATGTDSIEDSTKYSLQIEFLRSEGMRLNIKSYDYECSGEGSEAEAACERMKQMYKNAWILDRGDKFYVYTPAIFREYVTEFTPQPSPSLLRYRYDFIPLADPLHLAELFDRAENATCEGVETINMGNSEGKGKGKIEAYVVSYEFSYPAIKFAEKAKLRTWVSTEDYIPVKTELYATNETTATAIKFVFGFDSYEKDVFIPEENLTLPEDLKILPRH